MSLDETRKRLLGNFRDSATTHIMNMNRKLMELEADPTNMDIVKDIFRASHTLKGDARMMGFGEINKLAHEMETTFDNIRNSRVEMNSDLTEIFIEALDYLDTLVKDATNGAAPSIDISEILGTLQKLNNLSPDSGASTPNGATNNGTANHNGATTVALEAANASTNGKHASDTNLATIAKEPATNGVAAPVVTQSNGDGKTAKVVATSSDGQYTSLAVDITKLDTLMNITSELVLSKMEAEATMEKLRVLLGLLRERQRVNGPVRALVNTNDRDPSEVTTISEMKDVLVEVTDIDDRIEGLLRTTFKEYEEHASHLQNTVDELQNNVLNIRMLPIETLFQEFEPAIMTMAFRLKRATPEVIKSGGEIEVDKKVLDGLRDPLIHIIRNALDHGVELPEVRVAAGKARSGKIVMAAMQEGSYVYIRITDDGAGINSEKLKAKAVAKGLWSEARAKTASEEEIQNLIYEYGFSSAEIITDVSGFGVGMDAAKKGIERLGGSISHTTILGRGTTFTIKVPLTIATTRALLVKINGQIYAIPAPNIEAMLYLRPDDIMSRGGREVVLHREALIPLIKLEDLLGGARRNHPLFNYQTLVNSDHALLPTNGLAVSIAGNNQNGGQLSQASRATAGSVFDFVGLTLAEPEAYNIIQRMQYAAPDRGVRAASYDRLPGVIVGNGERRFCLVVEELVDETEIVIKSLSSLLSTRHIKSATILGNGQVVMILDVPDLIATARELITRGTIQRRSRVKQTRRKRILVVDDSITTRELEKSILEAQGYEVHTADDGTVALDMLIRNNIYDLVISDVEMPRMDGFELTTRIKSNPALRILPVIIVSSLNSDENKRRGISAGAQAYITKGDFNQNNLLDTIEYLTS